jgi:hypothetical protein
MRLALTAALGAALLVSVACGNKGEEAPPPPKAEPPAAKAPAADKAPPEPPPPVQPIPTATDSINVVDTGKEPRRELFFAAKKGDSFTVALTHQSLSQVEMKKKIPTMPVPAYVLELKVGVVEVTDAGDATLRFTIARADLDKGSKLPKGAKRSFEPQLATLVGQSGNATVSKYGLVRDAKFDSGAKLTPQMTQLRNGVEQSIMQLVVPLPKETLGAGANWNLVRDVDQGEIKVKQTTTYELTKLGKDSAEIKLSIKNESDKQPVNMPGLKLNQEATLQNLKGHGGGELKFVFSRPLAKKAKLQMSTASEVLVKGPDEKATMKITNMVLLSLETK